MYEINDPIDEQPQNIVKKVMKSMAVIALLTVIFGGLSYALIQLNHTVLKLSVSEGGWCGLAMALATMYYLWSRKRKLGN